MSTTNGTIRCQMCLQYISVLGFANHKCPAYTDKGVITGGWKDRQFITDTIVPIQSEIDSTLAERGNRYGAFTSHAEITQSLKDAMVVAPQWSNLAPDQKEALEMIVHKIGRILNGDPNYHDSWHDIVGYAKLVADRLLTGKEI